MKTVKKYYLACEEVAREFWKKYYKEDTTWEQELYYGGPVSGDTSGVWCFGDRYYSIYDMVTALEYSATYERLIEWYDETLEKYQKGESTGISLKNFLSYGWIGKQYSKEEIKESEDAMKEAEKELDKLLIS